MNIKKILSLLVFSTALIVILMNVADLGEIIDQSTANQQTEDLGVIKGCDPAKAICSIRTKLETGESVKLSLSTKDRIKVLSPFDIKLVIDGLSQQAINKIVISYEMQGMNMGENSQFFKLLQVNNKEASLPQTEWLANGMLSICVSGRSDWLATIKVYLDKKILSVRLPLSVYKN